MADHVDVDEFPSWFFAEVDGVGDDPWQVLLVHVETPGGLTVYWGDDPERPRRVFPLMDSMNPKLLGDYGTFLKEKGHLPLFVALSKVLQDLPEPLLVVQVIQRLKSRGVKGTEPFPENTVRAALEWVQKRHERRRAALDEALEEPLLA